MSTSHRICETCVYCSFAGNCDRYDKPLTSIEQPACDAYDIHPLIAENAKLRERIKELESCIRGDAEGIYRLAKNTGYLHVDELMESIHNRMRELGVEV